MAFPFWTAVILGFTPLGHESGLDTLVYGLYAIVIGALFVAITGLLISFLNRNSDKSSLSGYVISAVLGSLAVLALYLTGF